MIAQHYKDMLGAKSVIRQISEWSTARGAEIGYENVFDYSLGNPSVPAPQKFTDVCLDLLEHVDPVTLHGYTPTLTLPDVRAKVAESLNRRFGMDYTGDHIFMTTGAAGALGVDLLARKDARHLFILGAGKQAPFQIAATLLLLSYLAKKESFGVPYLSPLAPVVPAGMLDFLLAVPKRSMRRRDRLVGGKK